VPYQYFEVPTRFSQDRWIKAVEAKPGQAQAVHHIHVHVSSPRSRKPFGLLGMWQLYGFEGEKARVIGSYLPGRPVYSYRPGYGMKLPRGAKLTFEVHYTPIGKRLLDQSSLAVVFSDRPPTHEVHEDFVFMRELTIPAGDGHYVLTNTYKFQKPSRILSLTPHMHTRGKHWRFELVYPDGQQEVVLTVPRWEFDWQGVYRFERPIPVPQGTRILATAHYDNSVFNPNNPDPTSDAPWGPQSWHEMMNFRVTYALDHKDDKDDKNQ